MKIQDDSFLGVKAPIIGKFGFKVQSVVGDDTVTAILPLDAGNANARGEVGGPAITALLDFTMAACVRAHAPLAYTVATVELSVKFMRPAVSDIYAECRCESRGRRTCFATGTVFDEHGEKVAIASGTFHLIGAA